MRKKIFKKNNQTFPSRTLFGLLPRYSSLVATIIALTIFVNGLGILIPKIISRAIDDYTGDSFSMINLIIEFSLITFFIFIFTYLQNIFQVLTSERVARDMRNDIFSKLSKQSPAYIESATSMKLLTNLTSDVDAVKNFVSIAISSIVSSVFLIIGVSIMLIITDWKLALTVLSVMPIIATTFFFILRRVRVLFTKSQEVIDWLNKVISESILGSALIRLLNSQNNEKKKFLKASKEALDISFKILKLLSTLIPSIHFLTNIATLVIVFLGGYFVIQGEMSLGNFTAFNSYLTILIFPILILGFISNVIAQAQASYERILKVLSTPIEEKDGKLKKDLLGNIEMKNINIVLNEKPILKNISFSIKAGSKTALVGPTAAGKTQLLYLLSGLTTPASGEIFFDNKQVVEYEKQCLRNQIGFVFQDSSLFNLSLRENISFNNTVKDTDLNKAIETAELKEYVDSLPKKLDTIVSEKGTSLSGGQKQRIILARALALNPKILLLDDFTARIDNNTERKILNNIAKNYPQITILSVTQKIYSVKNYDQIILLMEGEILAKGTHKQLICTSPEYVQIFHSQKSTNQYEIDNEK